MSYLAEHKILRAIHTKLIIYSFSIISKTKKAKIDQKMWTWCCGNEFHFSRSERTWNWSL